MYHVYFIQYPFIIEFGAKMAALTTIINERREQMALTVLYLIIIIQRGHWSGLKEVSDRSRASASHSDDSIPFVSMGKQIESSMDRLICLLSSRSPAAASNFPNGISSVISLNRRMVNS